MNLKSTTRLSVSRAGSRASLMAASTLLLGLACSAEDDESSSSVESEGGETSIPEGPQVSCPYDDTSATANLDEGLASAKQEYEVAFFARGSLRSVEGAMCSVVEGASKPNRFNPEAFECATPYDCGACRLWVMQRDTDEFVLAGEESCEQYAGFYSLEAPPRLEPGCDLKPEGSYQCANDSSIEVCRDGQWVREGGCDCSVTVGDPSKPPYATNCKVHSTDNSVQCSYATSACKTCISGSACSYR